MKLLLVFIIILTAFSYPKSTKIYLATGCFWCVENDLEKLNGVKNVIPGYSRGDIPNPSYENVNKRKTTHREAVEVLFNSNIISYQKTLNTFFRIIDPTNGKGNFIDRGYSYTAAIFYRNKKEKKIRNIC